jgi:hypothetical protein
VTHRTGRTGSNSKAEVAKNTLAAVNLRAAGASQQNAAAELGVCRQTVGKYLRDCDIDWASLNAVALAPIKKKLIEELLAMADAVLAGEYPEKKVETWRGLMSDFAKVAGLNAPTTSITAHVDASSTQVQYRFLEHSHGLSADQIEEVFRFMDALPRRTVSIADCYPGQSGKPVPQLIEGEEVTDFAEGKIE